MKYKKGDIVKVYSLQSFSDGGFIQGTEGTVSQDQYGDSVLVSVKRNIKGIVKTDKHYEVYPEQLRFVRRPEEDQNAINDRFEILDL